MIRTAGKLSLACVAGSLVLLAIIVALSRTGTQLAPVSDTAVLESDTIAASRGALLVGPYSRYAWHHPGPIYLYLLVPFYLASGKLTLGLSAGVLTLNLAALTLIAWTATTNADGVSGAAMTGSLLLYLWRAEGLLVSPWNPHAIVLPTAALVVLAAAVVSGRVSLLPLVILVSSFIAQTHLGTAPFALAMSAAGVGRTLLIARAPEHRRRAIRAIAIALATGVVVWAPPLWEELTRTPGNLTRIWTYFVTSTASAPRARLPFAQAYSAWLQALSGVARPTFRLAEGAVLRRSRPGWMQVWALGQFATLGLGAAFAIRRDRRDAAALAVLLIVTSLVGLWSTAQIDDEIVDHQLFWMSVLGCVGLGVILDIAWPRARRFDRGTDRRASAVTLAALAVAAGLGVEQLAERTRMPVAVEQLAATTFADRLEEHMRSTSRTPRIAIDQDAWPVAAGVVARLMKAGLRFAVEDDWLPMFVESVKATGREDETIAIVAAKRREQLRDSTSELAARDPYYMLVDRPVR